MLNISLLSAVVLLICSATAYDDQHWQPTPVQWEIIRMSQEDTKRALGTVFPSTPDRYRCQETTYRRLGLMRLEGELYYLVRCDDGEQYSVRIKRDPKGTTGVMSCNFLRERDIDCDTFTPADFIQSQAMMLRK